MINSEIKIFGGSTGLYFAKGMCEYLGVELGKSEVVKFSDGNIFVKASETVRDKDVYLVQAIGLNPNEEFTEILFWMDAFKRASANSVTAIIPYFGYAKGDKKDEPRVSIRARVCAECIELAGADRVVAMDLHSPQIQGFFKKPVDHLFALPVLCEYVKSLNIKDLVVVSPDAGFTKQARKFASVLKAPVAIGDKTRRSHDEKAEILEIIGNVEGKNALIVDDFSISGGTLVDIAKGLKERGAKRIFACLSHFLLTEKGAEKVINSPIELIISTDSVNNPNILNDKIKIISVAPLFAEAIYRIHNRESVSPLFDNIPEKVFKHCIF
ncbi:MAG TPA: ribose-phosphate diphosphokinase [Clostridiaceae bacterium]